MRRGRELDNDRMAEPSKVFLLLDEATARLSVSVLELREMRAAPTTAQKSILAVSPPAAPGVSVRVAPRESMMFCTSVSPSPRLRLVPAVRVR